jgi:hypothetical protein
MGAAASPGFRPAEKHLQALIPDATNRGIAIGKARDELSQCRTYPVPRAGSVKGSGEFFVVFKADGTVEDTKIIDGNTGLSPMVVPLKKAHFAPILPANTDAKLVRRGIMLCNPPDTTCQFVLLTVDTVRNLF